MSIFPDKDSGVGSGEPQKSEATYLTYHPSMLVIDRKVPGRTLVEEFNKLLGSPIGPIEYAGDATEALEKIKQREKPYDVVLFKSGRKEKLGMPLAGLMRQITDVSPGTLPVLVTGGDLGAPSGVPNKTILNAVDIGYIYDAGLYPGNSKDYERLFAEVKVASWSRKQTHPQGK